MYLLGHYDRAVVTITCAVGSGEARRQVDEAGMLARVHHLVASTNPPAVAAGGATAALLQATALMPYAGFAVTAKPSVNLLLLLQVRMQTFGMSLCHHVIMQVLQYGLATLEWLSSTQSELHMLFENSYAADIAFSSIMAAYSIEFLVTVNMASTATVTLKLA